MSALNLAALADLLDHRPPMRDVVTPMLRAAIDGLVESA